MMRTAPTPDTSPQHVETGALADFVVALTEMDATQIQIIDDRAGSGYWVVHWWLLSSYAPRKEEA